MKFGALRQWYPSPSVQEAQFDPPGARSEAISLLRHPGARAPSRHPHPIPRLFRPAPAPGARARPSLPIL